MTNYTYTRNGEPIPFGPFISNEVEHPAVALTIWSDPELAAHGIVRTEVPTPQPTAAEICREIDNERDARIDGGFTFGAHTYQSRTSDRENVMGAAQLALAYLGAGGDPSSLRWANPDDDFVWIAADNQTVPLTAADVVALFQAGVAFKSALTFYARAMKDAVIASEEPASVEWRDNWPA